MAYFRNGDKPEDRLGIYKSLNEVPTDRRLENLEGMSPYSNFWEAFMEDREDENDGSLSDSRARKYDRFYRKWTGYLEGSGTHFAFASPDDVEGFMVELLEDRTLGTVYDTYFSNLHLLYAFFWYHANYQHEYSPVLMAASVEGSKSRELWMHKVNL